MKKLIYCAAALATALFAGSCQQELLDTPAGENTVTYTVELPDVQTKAIGDGTNVDQLVYEVWKTGEDGVITESSTRLYQKTINLAPEAPRKWIVTLNLVQNQTYKALFWAQVGKPKGHENYNTDQLTNVYYAYDVTKDYSSNQESYAAFYGTDVLDTHTPLKGKTITLTRPFAQLNIGTLNTADKDEYSIKMDKSSVVVTVPTQFNVATSAVAHPQEITFNLADVPNDPATLPVSGTEYGYVAMNYVFAGAKTTSSVEYTIETTITPTASASTATTATINKTIPNVPLQENYRTNIVGNLLTSSAQYEVVINADWADGNEPDGGYVVDVTEVSTDEDLYAALHKDWEHIVIDLGSVETKSGESINYTINPTNDNSGSFVWGGTNTKTITINGNGNKLIFNYTNGDWQSIKCVNPEAKIIINNTRLTNSGKNDGPWARHDIFFSTPVELNNVVSDKAFALNAYAKLTNVSISDVHPKGNSDVYGLWIRPNGQTVDLDDVSITPSELKRGDRAIKIDPEDMKNQPSNITLNVKNSTFVSQKKAAVLVNSPAGAIINWGEGNNIEGVAEDPINAVWVDDGATDSYDNVVVDGATKVIEGTQKAVLVKTAEELQNAVNNAVAGVNEIGFGADITGNVTIPQNDKINIIINGLGKKYDGTITVDGNSRHTGAETLVIKNVNFEHSGSGLYFIEQNDAAEAVRYPHNVTVEDCTFKGDGTNVICGVRYRQGYNIAVKNCTAEGLFLFMWTTGCQNITVDNVDVIDSYKEGGFSLGVKDQITVKNSKVVASDPYGYGVRIDGDANGTWNIADNDFTADAPVIVRKSKTAHTLNLSGNTLTTTKDYQVIVCANDNYKAGEELVEPTVEYTITGAQGLRAFPVIAAKIGDTKYKTLASAVKAVKEGETINILGTLSEGSIKLPSTLKNVTFSGEEGATLKDMTIRSADGNSLNYDGITFEGITFDNSNLVFTGMRSGSVVYKNLKVNSCIFKNVVRTDNMAVFHTNTNSTTEAINGFEFTNNVIDGVSGSSNSGIHVKYATGKVLISGNVINNVVGTAYQVYVANADGIEDEVIVTNNTFSGSVKGRAQAYGANIEGGDNVNFVVSHNIFKDITESHQICYWNFNNEKTAVDFSYNYYSINILENPGRIYFNTAAESVEDLMKFNVFPIYTELNADGTINTNSLYSPSQE